MLYQIEVAHIVNATLLEDSLRINKPMVAEYLKVNGLKSHLTNLTGCKASSDLKVADLKACHYGLSHERAFQAHLFHPFPACLSISCGKYV